MKNAIIDPRQSVSEVTGWVPNTNPPEAIIQEIPNSARVAEVAEQTFPVAEPLFWTPCADDVVADQWYYDMISANIYVVPAPPPVSGSADQPVVTGAQVI
jgi:hypothetical protein